MIEAKNLRNEQGKDSLMVKNITEKFIGAFTEMESVGDVEPIVKLFAINCEVSNDASQKNFRGIDGVREFWTNYLDSFKVVCSVFQKETFSKNKATLEWKTEGKSKNGLKLKYKSVSILETKGEKITHFSGFFDPKSLGEQVSKQNHDKGK